MDYHFAVNKMKLQRAIASVGADEEAVRAEYEKIGGLIAPGFEREAPVVAPEPVVEDEVKEPAEVVEAPMPKKRAAKKK